MHSRFSSTISSHSQWFSLLRHAIATFDLLLGKCTHARIITSGNLLDPFITNNLINMYGKCGSLSSARRLFDVTPRRDLVTWNSMLSAYANAGDADSIREGFRLFRLLRESYVLTSRHTLAPVFRMCLLSSSKRASQALHGYAFKIGLEWDVFVAGALVNIYAKFGRIREARVLFDGMPVRDVVLWNVMIKAYVEMGFEDEALLLFSEFHRSGLRPVHISVRSVLMGVSLTVFEWQFKQVQAYAMKLFCFDGDWEVAVWNKALSGYLQAREAWKAIDFFARIITSGVAYDSTTLLVMLSVVASVNHLDMGKQIHGVVVKLEYDRVLSVANSLLKMYLKAGSVNYARVLFSRMKEVDLISWNTVISGCALSGSEELSLSLFISLLRSGLLPDQFTIAIASVLTACCTL